MKGERAAQGKDPPDPFVNICPPRDVCFYKLFRTGIKYAVRNRSDRESPVDKRSIGMRCLRTKRRVHDHRVKKVNMTGKFCVADIGESESNLSAEHHCICFSALDSFWVYIDPRYLFRSEQSSIVPWALNVHELHGPVATSC